MFKHRMILVGIAAALVLTIGGAVTAVIWALTREDPTYEVTITTFPEQVQLQLEDAEPIDHQGTVTYTVDDDELHLTASREDFTNHSETIELSEEAATEITIALDPETAEAEEQRREDSDYYQGQADFTRESLEHTEDLYESNEILQELPKEADTFRAYVGIPEDDDHEFGVHVYVYQDNEDEGEADFRAWAQDRGYDPDELDITIHVDDAPPVTADPPPSADELEQADQPDVEAFTPDPDGLDPDEVALEFLTIANTHDASQEDTPTAAQQRAAPLMTDDLSDTLGTVENPTVPPNWWDAIDAEAVSYPWIYDISEERSNDQGRVHYTAQVCWAWIPADEDESPMLDNPRTWDFVVAEDQDGTFHVTDYDYQDAYHGDDPDQSVCSLD